jgi:hypothetical protein
MRPAGRVFDTAGLDNRLTDDGRAVSPMHRPLLYSPDTLFLCSWYLFLLEAE